MINNYILFLAQEANFQTRSILIPAEKFLAVESRKKEYEALQNDCLKNVKFTRPDGKIIRVNNLVTMNIIWDGGIGTCEKNEHSEFLHHIIQYADMVLDNCYFRKEDKDWYDSCIFPCCKGVDHVENYNRCKNMKK